MPILFLSRFSLSLHLTKQQKNFTMKNLILALAFALLATVTPALAQKEVSKAFKLKSDVAGKTPAQAAKDTASGTVEKSQSVAIAGYWNTVSVQTMLKKLTGTPAGKVYFEGSLNGAANSWDKADSLTVLNVATQTKVFNVTPSKYVYYRIRFVGTGTHTTEFYSFAVARKQ